MKDLDIHASRDDYGMWYAIDLNTYDGAPDSPRSMRLTGHGKTREEAIQDLVWQVEEMREEEMNNPEKWNSLQESKEIEIMSKLITESTSWNNQRKLEVEELEDPSLGDYSFTVEFTIGYSCTPGEEMVRYYPDGSGYPGSPPECEWEILEINKVDVYDANGDEAAISDTPDLQEKLKAAIYKVIDDDKIMEIVGGDYEEDDASWERDY